MKPPAFQFYADDFLSGVSDMTQSEVGAYILLLCTQWTRGEIPADAERAALIAKGSVSPHVLAKFPNGKNARLESVRLNQIEFRQSKSIAGRFGAQKRWHNDNKLDSSPIAQPSLSHSSPIVLPIAIDSSPSPTPIHTPLPPKGGEESAELNLSMPAQTQPPKAKAKVQLRAERLMARRESTPLTSGEARAYSKNRAAIEATTEDDWKLLERFYAAPQSKTYARKDLATLLNNWNGEIDRARKWHAEATPKQSEPFLKIS